MYKQMNMFNFILSIFTINKTEGKHWVVFGVITGDDKMEDCILQQWNNVYTVYTFGLVGTGLQPGCVCVCQVGYVPWVLHLGRGQAPKCHNSIYTTALLQTVPVQCTIPCTPSWGQDAGGVHVCTGWDRSLLWARYWVDLDVMINCSLYRKQQWRILQASIFQLLCSHKKETRRFSFIFSNHSLLFHLN